DAGQLTGITYKKADNSLIGDLAYTYDANGRRTKTSGSLAKTDLPDTINTASYDANNRLATWGSQILNYDANGNLTSDGLKTYIWNARNQLIQIKDSTGTEVASFSYDALGRRQTKTINGVSTGFMYDGVNIVQELNGASPINNYISAGVDQVFVQQSGAGASATNLTYLTDALGSTIRLTNAAGDKVVDYSYDPYGNTKADTVINNSFQYTGRENDGTGLYYYRARYYSPATHRFISEDPIGLNGGINTYGYVRGNPVTHIDPLGLADLNLFNPQPGSHDLTGNYPGGNAWNEPAFYTVAGHGNPGNMSDDRNGTSPWKPLWPENLANMIKSDPNWKNRPVKLGSCNTGISWPQGHGGKNWEPFAQTLAHQLGVPVTAPTGFIYYTPRGIIGTSATDPGPISSPGQWKTFYPKGR
ncbi:RHS repeat-associated core domain-containing protein, partial [Undibacterium sp. Ji42W]|uniref:RHS repeat-associated core domain-containing protein n=1 Tax=Undibacterium sp. Ji42W TaxID=3413039 RepID=UPI003BF1DD8D